MKQSGDNPLGEKALERIQALLADAQQPETPGPMSALLCEELPQIITLMQSVLDGGRDIDTIVTLVLYAPSLQAKLAKHDLHVANDIHRLVDAAIRLVLPLPIYRDHPLRMIYPVPDGYTPEEYYDAQWQRLKG